MKNKILEKTFRILQTLAEHGGAMPIGKLGTLAGVDRSTAQRIVADLCEAGYFAKSDYRSVEPGIGMLFLGQSVFDGACFPRRALAELTETSEKLGVSSALGGLFLNRIVYFYRGGYSPIPFHGELCNSNLALCILVRTRGEPETMRLLDGGIDLKKRLDFFLRNGYAVQKDGNTANISFPLETSNGVYALGFYGLKDNAKIGTLITECSLLRNRLQKNLLPQ